MKSQIATSRFEITNCDLKCEITDCNYVRIRIMYEPLKNDKNIYIENLKNDNFGDSIMSKFSTNDKWKCHQ